MYVKAQRKEIRTFGISKKRFQNPSMMEQLVLNLLTIQLKKSINQRMQIILKDL